MHIVIENIDKDSFALRGFTPTPSVRIQFSSRTFSGTARLVPACDFADIKPGAVCAVEIAQESVTGLRMADISANIGVEPLLAPGDFKVRGTVRCVVFPSEPANNRITYVQVGDADFCLALHDLGDLRPEEGTAIEFIVHDVTMWDAAL